MFDLLLTIALVYFAYRGYQWYARVQEQAKVNGGTPLRELEEDQLDQHPQPGDENDYIEYEEMK